VLKAEDPDPENRIGAPVLAIYPAVILGILGLENYLGWH